MSRTLDNESSPIPSIKVNLPSIISYPHKIAIDTKMAPLRLKFEHLVSPLSTD